VADHGAPAISTHYQIGPNIYRAGRRVASNAHDPVILFDEASNLGLHLYVERGIAAALFGEEIQEVPLWHERHKTTPRPEVRHLTQENLVTADPSADLAYFLMRPLEKLVEQTQLVHRFKSRGVNRVAAEVSQEVSVLLQNQDVDSCACEQEAKHHPGRAASGDTTPAVEFLR